MRRSSATLTAVTTGSAHLADFVSAYDVARRLETLRGLTPFDVMCKTRTTQPYRFGLDPIHQMPGLNI